MKRWLAMVLCLFLFTSVIGALADSFDFSSYSDEELVEMQAQLQQELDRRQSEGTTEGEASEDEPILMQKGSKGDDVKKLQENLIALGYLSGKADGDFGNGTQKAVMAYQKANGLPEDGNVTQSLLDRIEQEVSTLPPKPISFTAVDLHKKFEQNKIAAESELVGVTIEVSGKIDSIDSSLWGGDYYVKLASDSWGLYGVYCYFDDENVGELASLKAGQKIVIRGVCSGSTSITNDPELQDCEIVK